ncbi:MAG TPA: NAD(P)H-dependent glycerol-3-phosphate dehydrogenase [Actinomycetes bacterium]|jgi:glycerol-3-phosphate dehydrogenase (NAD(P)+)|nr:NAD(P)H-dependent glycerol-3-phosphate dehydrogenase [Actinomycetes bacterium]
MSTIAILGSGVMGSALTFPLADNGHDIRLVGTHLDRDIIASIQATGVHPGLERKLPEAVRPHQVEEIDAAFDGAGIIVSGVNSFGVRWAGQRLAALLRPEMLVIAVAKGLAADEDGRLRILPDVLAEQVAPELRSRTSWAAIGGPSIAGEVAARRDTCVLFTGHQQPALERLAATFRTDWYHVWTSTDVVGVETSAAMKNCYAVAVGLAEGILERLGHAGSRDRNHNYEAALFAQATTEIAQMVRLLGGRSETPYGLAGVGDMFVTCTGGRNVRMGRLLGGGLRFSEARARMGDITLEGAAAIQVVGGALPKLTDRGVIGPEDFPLLRQLHAVVGRDQRLEIPWSAFFGGEAGAAVAVREAAG